MKLTIIDRINILNVMPQQENLQTLLIAKDLSKKVELLEEEKKLISYAEIQTPNGVQATWKKENEIEVEVEFSAVETKLIKEIFNKLDSEKKISVSMIETASKFLM